MIGRTNALTIIGGAGGGGFEIELPSEFATATNVYYFKVNDGKYLISANITDIGVWEYSTSTGTMAQKYNSGDSWNFFHQDGDGVFISHVNSLDSSCLYYETLTGNCSLLIEISHSNQEYANAMQSIKIDNKTYLYTSYTGSSSYIYIFDDQTKLATKVNGSALCSWTPVNVNGDWIFLGNLPANARGSRIQKLDTTNNELTTLYSGFYASKYVMVNGGALLFGASTTDSKGILFYDNSTKTVTLGYPTGVWSSNYDNYSASETKVFWCGSTNTNCEAGTLMFDVATKTFTKIEDTSNRRVPFAVGDDCLFGGQPYSDSGIRLYKNSTGEIIPKYTSNVWQYFHKIGNVVLISSSSSSTGILLYNISGETATKVYSSGYYFNGFEDVGEDCLIYSSQQTLGVLLYDSSALTITQKFSSGRFNLATKDGNNTYLENSNKTTYAGKVLYDASDGSVKLAEWKIS